MENCGFVLATTGPEYTALARQAVLTIRESCPGYPVDLFTDSVEDIPEFDQVHKVGKDWHRPKMEALFRSRFERTIYLDADLFVVADLGDVFDLLEKFDFAAAQDQDRNGKHANRTWTRPIPAAYPQFNGGVMGVRKSPETDAFLRNWEHQVFTAGAPRDQPALRELLYDSDLRVATLPAEYNLHAIRHLGSWTSMDCAPRVVHHHWLHTHIGSDRPQIKTLDRLLGTGLHRHIKALAKADRTLTGKTPLGRIKAYSDLPFAQKLKSPRYTSNAQRIFRKLKKLFS